MCRTRLKKIIVNVFRKVLHTECQPVRYTLLFNSVCQSSSVTSAVQNEQFTQQFSQLPKTKMDGRGLTKDCLSCVHAQCGFIINTLWKKTFSTGAVRKDDEYCALCSSAAAAVAIGQLQLQRSHYSLVALQAFASRNVTSEGASRGLEKNFLGSLSLAIFSGPLINYAIIRPLLITDVSPDGAWFTVHEQQKGRVV